VKRPAALVVVLAALLALAPPLDAFLLFGGPIRWGVFPVRYFVSNSDVPGVTAEDLRVAVDAAFAAWNGLDTAVTSAEFVGFTGAEPGVADGLTVIGFQSRPELDRVLGQTSFQVDSITDQLVEADIFLNATFPWSVAPAGESGRFDTQSIATHEIGHLFGLGHSALGETELIAGGGRRVIAKRAVMFPIAYPPGNVDDRQLKVDDAAGLSTAYPTPAFDREAGAIQGRVRKNGVGIFGAHVVAIHPGTGVAIGAFSLDGQGSFVVRGLDPGFYLVRVEPLDDADAGSFFAAGAGIDTDFRVTYFPRLVAVPSGGAGESIQVEVVAR
jgi:hypothetical protein